MNNGTYDGDIAEIEFTRKFNKNKDSKNFSLYIKACNINDLNDCYMVRVTTKQYSELSKQIVMTRADSYLIESKDELIKSLLFDNDYYLDESMLSDNNVNYNYINKSGISIKMNDSESFQILKLTPESFKTLFGEYELGAGASIYCLRENEIQKNDSVFAGWNTSLDNVINKIKDELPELVLLNENINIVAQMNIYKELKVLSNKKIKELIDNNKKIQEIIFNGYYIYKEPYTASYFYKGNEIKKLDYIPFSVTTGSGRSHGNFTIVLKPKK